MTIEHPLVLGFLLLLPLIAAIWRWRGRRVSRLALGLRLAMLALLVLALANPILATERPTAGRQIVLVDQSDSLTDTTRTALRQQGQAFVQERGDGAQALLFGGGVAPDTGDASVPAAVQADITNLAAALRAAGTLTGPGGTITLLSDGGATEGDTLAAARELAAQGIQVDTVAAEPASRIDVWVAEVRAPPVLRQGEEYSVDITVGSTGTGQARLQLFDGTTPLEIQDVDVAAGITTFTYRNRAGNPGIARLRAEISAEPDAFPQNNSAATTARVAPPPRVLIVEGNSGGSAPLRVALRNEGVQSDVVQAAGLPPQLDRLEPYEGLVLVNISAGELSLDQMTTLREFVRSEGRGLVVTGGRSSLTLGAYKGTPLEEALPVTMDPPPRPQRSQVTMLLIVDQSASMGGSFSPSKLDMAKEATILATQALREEDRLGVLAFDLSQNWVVPFQQLGTGLSVAQAQERIGSIGLGTGTNIYDALFVGLNELSRQPGETRHAVLLTDGRSFESQRSPYNALLEAARAENITLSTIAIGSDSDTELLRQLANAGAGRYHFAATPNEIPRLTLQESDIIRSAPQIEGAFRAEVVAQHPLIQNFSASDIPQLGGYVATTLKPEAELVLDSPEEDPVLAVWQYGLGRAVAWTPSVEEPWADSWSNWNEYGQFWAQIVRYTLPEPNSGPLQVRATPRGRETLISVDALQPGGAARDLAETTATITLPGGTTQTVPLQQTGPGRYSASVVLPENGPYGVAVAQQASGTTAQSEIGYVQPYAAEYLPVAGGAALLEQISATTGGSVLAALPGGTASAAPDIAAAPPTLAPWLLGLALLLWLAEIAERRGWLRR